MNLRKRVSLISGLLVLMLVSCSKEDTTKSGEMGTFTMNLNANSEVIGLQGNSRADEGTMNDVPVDDDTPSLPDVNNFSVTVSSLGEQIYEWHSYEEMNQDEGQELRVGTYQVKAWYGDVSKEGFELPYFEGNQEFSIKKGENTPVDVTCYLGNAQVKINYTEAFKNYFSSYSGLIATSLGNEIEYAQDESRAAYMAPGELVVKVKVKKSGQAKETTYQAKVFTAEARHIYALTLDVDAGSTTMTVSFSDDVAGEEVRFDVSDAALNAPAPYFKANGFTEDGPLKPIEGVKPETVTAFVNAVAGIQSCRLTTTSAYLLGKEWPKEVDLTNVGEEAAILNELGLTTKGLTGNRDQMAQVDFTKLIENLPKGESHVFKLEAVDRYGKVSETPLELTVTPQDCAFSVSATQAKAPFYGNTCQVNVSFKDGNPENVRFQLAEGNKEVLEFVRSEELPSEDGLKTYTVYLKAPETVKFVDPFKVSASYLSYNKETDALPVGIGILVDNPGDVWAKRAVFHVYNATDLASVKLQKQQSDSWTDVTTEVSGSYSLIAKGLDSGTALTFHAVEGEESSNSVNVTTEEELQVPNAGFEDWSVKSTWSDTFAGGKNIYAYYPYTDINNQWWSTSNDITTQKVDGVYYSWYYAVYPGVVPTNAKELHTASWKIGREDKSHSGDAAVDIATVGWGLNHWGPTGGSDPESRTAGSLFVGVLQDNQEILGKEFNSRPSKVQFYYKYYSYNGEYTIPFVRIWNKDGAEIGYGEVKIANTVDSYQVGLIPITYTVPTDKAASITIVFKSTTVEQPGTTESKGSDGLFSGYGDSRHIGSILTVDDVKLIYE